MTIDLLRHRRRDDDEFSAAVWNRLIEDVSAGLVALQQKGASFDEARRELIQLGLFRLNDAILPALDRLREIQSSGFLVADIAPDSEVGFATGEVEIAIDPDLKTIFRPTAFVALVRHDTAEDWAVARVLGYSEETGVILLDILAVSGDPGPHEDVIVSATGGGAAGQIAFLLASKAVLTQTLEVKTETEAVLAGAAVQIALASDWAGKAPGEDVSGPGTRSARHWASEAGAERAAAAAARGEAVAASGAASGHAGDAFDFAGAAGAARDKAQSWAAAPENAEVEPGQHSARHHAAKAAASALAAATFDPASYYPKAEIDGALGAKADAAAVYTKGEVDGALGAKADSASLGEMATRGRATVSQIRAASGDAGLTATRLGEAVAQVAGVTEGAPGVSIAWGDFVNGTAVSLTANRAMLNPSGIVAGTTRSFVLQSSSATARSISSFGSYFKGSLPTISVTNTAKVIVHLFAYSATEIQIAVAPWS